MEEAVIVKQIWPHCYITQLPKMPAPLCASSLALGAGYGKL